MTETELIDVYNDSGIKIGVKKRGEAHRDGSWHRSFHCWIIRREGGRRFIVFQLRGDKVIYPFLFDITAAGHVRSGETIKEASREIGEELGLKIRFENLVFLGTRHEAYNLGEITNREFCEVYLLEDQTPLSKYELQEKEVAGVFQVELDNFLKLFNGEANEVPAEGVMLRSGKPKKIERVVKAEEFIPRKDRYYLLVGIMAERYFEGKKRLAV